jgi:hypothetical protein
MPCLKFEDRERLLQTKVSKLRAREFSEDKGITATGGSATSQVPSPCPGPQPGQPNSLKCWGQRCHSTNFSQVTMLNYKISNLWAGLETHTWGSTTPGTPSARSAALVTQFKTPLPFHTPRLPWEEWGKKTRYGGCSSQMDQMSATQWKFCNCLLRAVGVT